MMAQHGLIYALVARLFFRSVFCCFFWLVFCSFFWSFWGAILGSFWSHAGLFFCFFFRSSFVLFFWSFLGRFGVRFWDVFGAKIGSKCVHVICDFYWFSICFFTIFSFRWVLCSSYVGSFFRFVFGIDLFTFFGPILGRFGRLLGVEIGHFSHWFLASIFGRFLVRFWGHLGRLLGGFWGSKSVIFGIDFLMIFECRSMCACMCLRASESVRVCRPGAVQERPRAAKSGPRRSNSGAKAAQERPKTANKRQKKRSEKWMKDETNE